MAMCRTGKLPWQRGAALVTALVLMLVVLMIGVAAARAAVHAERTARMERDRHIAFAAAEAALSDAERDIDGVASPGRAALFAAGPSATSKGCGHGADDLGLCAAAAGAAVPQWQLLDLAQDEGAAVAYGTYTGARMATGAGSLPARDPRYVIEPVPMTGAAAGSGNFFRITAIGFGARESTRVVLQSFYRKAPPAAPPAAVLPVGRIAWREVANWPELHQAAIE
jgi:Tfp pilus assembly protein PilX